jgi:hypothetical protein
VFPGRGTIAPPAHPVATTPRGGSDAGERASISVGCSADRCASSLKQSQSAVRVGRRSNIWARASRSGHGRGVTLDGKGPYKSWTALDIMSLLTYLDYAHATTSKAPGMAARRGQDPAVLRASQA